MAATAPPLRLLPARAPPPPGGFDDLKAQVFIFLPWEALGPPSVRPSGAQKPLRPMTLTKLAFSSGFLIYRNLGSACVETQLKRTSASLGQNSPQLYWAYTPVSLSRTELLVGTCVCERGKTL